MPKSLDVVDSAVLALRVLLVGKLGRLLNRGAVWSIGGAVVALNPHGWALLLAALASFMSAELLSRAVTALPVRRLVAPAG